ncbi:OsmC/Ohr family [Dichotomopilus funicola]|uniref:OsmC/Ohr family n=1 Tax=Dichotomopilus funicola TaxID=1934379 RepID=A0AAN6UWX3_9PEZI|nr:OsmC/Ohr family [Dichotomopilus funicola]
MSRRLLTTLTTQRLGTAAKPFLLPTTRLFSSTPHQSAPRSDILPVQVAGTGTGTLQHVTVPGKSYAFVSDTYPVLGGADSAPSPVVYALASLSACNQVTGHVVARDHGITLGKWNVEVDGQLPTGVLVQGLREEDVGGPNWEAVSLRVRVQTDVDGEKEGEKWERFVSEVERRCPITRLFRDSGLKYESTWVNEKLE